MFVKRPTTSIPFYENKYLFAISFNASKKKKFHLYTYELI
nr:hypothetical protein bcere0006_34150 [Bacillus wiedmannii]